jgi:type IV secretory pathway protease TraF
MPEFIVGAYIVPKGMVWLYGNEPRSFDSKYYGPVPESNVLALLKPVITW